MATSAKIVAFSIAASEVATTVIQVRGVGFTPLVVIPFYVGRAETVDTAGRATIDRGIGFATAVGTEQGVATHSTDAANPSVCNNVMSNDFITISSAGAQAGAAFLDALVSDGFDVEISNQFPNDIRVFALCLGGDSITDKMIGLVAGHTATGIYDAATTVGFTPTFVMLAHDSRTTVGVAAHSNFNIGAAINSTNQFVVRVSARNAQGAGHVAEGYALDTVEISAHISGGPVADRISFHDFAPSTGTGFRFNSLEFTNSSIGGAYLALAGGDYAIGSLLTRTDTADITVSGLSFQPAAVILISACRTENTQDATSNPDQISIGAITADDSMCMSCRENHSTTGAETSTAIDYDKCYINLDSTGAVQGLMEKRSINSDGFTVGMTDTDPSASWVGYIAIGPAAAAAATNLMGAICM